MGLTVFQTSDERRVGAGVEQLLREALARAKGSNALVLAPSLSVSLEVQRALEQAGGLAMGVDCATINTWCELRWALYGDGRTLVKHPMRAVLMELVLAQASREGALAPLDAGAGTVQLLCEAAQRKAWRCRPACSSDLASCPVPRASSCLPMPRRGSACSSARRPRGLPATSSARRSSSLRARLTPATFR